MDLGNMPSQRINYIAQKILSGFVNSTNGSASIVTFLTSTSNTAVIGSITTSQLNSLGLNSPLAVASIPAANLPKAFVFIILIRINNLNYILFCIL